MPMVNHFKIINNVIILRKNRRIFIDFAQNA